MNIDVDKIVVSLDVVAPDAVVVDASAMLPTQVVVISDEVTPTVTPLQIIDYGYTSIECAFDVTTEQAEEVVKGVLCGTTNPPTFENADYRLLHGQGSMDLVIAGLHNNTEYYLRPYALSNLGYKYGDVVSQRTKNNPIPNEYQLVEYLSSNGNQVIIIDKTYYFETNVDIDYVLDIEVPDRVIFGGRQVSPYWLFTQSAPTKYRFDYGVQNVFNVPNKQQTRVKRKFVNEGARFYYYENGNVVNYTQSRSGISCNVITLYNGYTDASRMLGGSTISVYFCRFWKENDYDIQLYPVYRKVDDKPGMYDLVNNVFYTNQGTGEFTVGPDKEWDE